MSFTISHAATALPFLKTRLVFSALVIGTMSPDFEYIICSDFMRLGAHSFPGLFLFCVPVGFIVLFLYHSLWKNVLLDLSPDYIRRRIAPVFQKKFHFLPFSRLINILLSLLLGAVLHVLLDAVTHGHGIGTKLFPWLNSTVPGFSNFPWWALFFGITSVGGGIILVAAIAVWFFRLQPQTNITPRKTPIATYVFITIAGIGFCLCFCVIPHSQTGYSPTRHIAYFMLGAMIYTTTALTILGIIRLCKQTVKIKE